LDSAAGLGGGLGGGLWAAAAAAAAGAACRETSGRRPRARGASVPCRLVARRPPGGGRRRRAAAAAAAAAAADRCRRVASLPAEARAAALWGGYRAVHGRSPAVIHETQVHAPSICTTRAPKHQDMPAPCSPRWSLTHTSHGHPRPSDMSTGRRSNSTSSRPPPAPPVLALTSQTRAATLRPRCPPAASPAAAPSPEGRKARRGKVREGKVRQGKGSFSTHTRWWGRGQASPSRLHV